VTHLLCSFKCSAQKTFLEVTHIQKHEIIFRNFWMILSVTPVNLNPLKTTLIVNVPSTEHEITLYFIQTIFFCVHIILTESRDYFFKNFSKKFCNFCSIRVEYLLWYCVYYDNSHYITERSPPPEILILMTIMPLLLLLLLMIIISPFIKLRKYNIQIFLTVSKTVKYEIICTNNRNNITSAKGSAYVYASIRST
jgi:hypothetical protein